MRLHQSVKVIGFTAHRLAIAHAASPLPEHPHTALIERWMLKTYLAHWRDRQGDVAEG